MYDGGVVLVKNYKSICQLYATTTATGTEITTKNIVTTTTTTIGEMNLLFQQYDDDCYTTRFLTQSKLKMTVVSSQRKIVFTYPKLNLDII